ncbi:ATP-binding protein [Vibrio ziniensis]|uniref:histidine kinase n=1 Tax=Vibrio ziniensis TaxID=2711221 RepID=A0A6G7CGX2_9VIBR|nr:ATP-binding protein [Vibrio ziniensis]QIH41286.1 HAMP domain-containing protein [Vibrio ziniensis]
MSGPRFWKSFKPNSLVARTLLLTLLAVVIAQGIATSVWYSQSKAKELEGIHSASASMAGMFASTVTFFQSLPVRYRHIILDQIRNMGGTRFFVSFNKESLIVEPIEETSLKKASVKAVKEVLNEKLTNVGQVLVDFSRPERLRLLKNSILMNDLPKSWVHHTLTLEPLNPPVMVVQIELDEKEWIYIAALLPSPYITLDDTIIGKEQIIFLLSSTSILLVLTYLLMRRQVRPLKNLARAANDMSMGIEQRPLNEEGASELITATRAFNLMQQRIRRYVSDRENLFSAISHDLKTPITRLRLRAELLDDDVKREKFNRDLDELEMMVKGALQCVRDTDLHENNDYIDLNELIMSIAEGYNLTTQTVHFKPISIEPIVAKPLAMKRALTNLINNGVKYGHEVWISIDESEDWITVTIEDRGPGIPKDKLERVFEPYFRIANDNEGHGLGLGISRNILRGHGGDMVIENLLSGGLRVKLFMPPTLEV